MFQIDSVQEVFKYIGTPIDFEMHHLSEVGFERLSNRHLIHNGKKKAFICIWCFAAVT